MKHVWLAACLVVIHGAGASAQSPEFGIAEHPQIRFGDAVTLHLLGRFDVTTLDRVGHAQQDDVDGVDVERRRIGVSGEVLGVVKFEVERELEDDPDPWRDAWVGVTPASGWLARAGKFKVPFSRARTTSLVKHAFVNRPLASEALAPGRQLGVGVEGELFDEVLSVEAGGFRESVSSAGLPASQAWQDTAMGAVRVGARPFRPWLRALRNVEVAVAATVGQRPEGLDGITGQSYAGEADLFSEVYVNGRRLRTGVEVSWSKGPINLSGEYLRVADERRAQGIRGEDLSDLVANGWHASAAWRVFGTGRERERSLGFAPLEGSAGTFEIVGRVEALSFGSAGGTGAALRNPRAAHLLGNTDHAMTFGGNWFFSRFGRLQCNAIGERIEDALRSPVGSDRRFWTVVTRLQLHL